MQSSIKFFLKASKGKKKGASAPNVWTIREYFTFVRPAGSNGELSLHFEGLVDEDIRREHPKEYSEFAAYVEANKDCLFEEAKAGYVE